MEKEKGSLESFLKWAAELGISDSTKPMQSENPVSCLGQSIFVSHFPNAGGRGLGAVRELRKGELILRVPKSALMTRESLVETQKLSVSLDIHPCLSSIQVLTVCLLYEMGKGKCSRWYPYLVQLPHQYDTLASFSQFERRALQVDDAVWVAEKAASKAELEWKEAIPLMEALKLKLRLQTFGAWLWASATISSRTLHIPWDDAGCLCPVGDLFNYAAPSDDSEQCVGHSQRLTDGGYEEDIAAYCFYARRNYKKGEQVLLSYGTYTNLELLEHYGFLLNENPNCRAFIPLELNMYSSSSWPKQALFIQQKGEPSFVLLSALRLWAAPPNQRRSLGHLAYSGSQLSTENEISVMKWMKNKCYTVLQNLPSSFEEDTRLLCTIDKMQFSLHNTCMELSGCRGEVYAFLEANGLHIGISNAEEMLSKKARRSLDRWRLAVEWRLRFKKVLVDCISYCTNIISSLTVQNGTK